MTDRKLILVADVPEGIAIAKKALSEKYDLLTAPTLKKAEQLLIESKNGRKIDLIIAGLHFDDSQMIALLQYIRSVDHLDYTAFLPIQARSSTTEVANEALDNMLKILGSCSVLVLNKTASTEACKQLNAAVDNALLQTVNSKRFDIPSRKAIGSPEEKDLRA